MDGREPLKPVWPPSLDRLLDHPRLPLFAALLGVLLASPALGAGIGADDWLHRTILDPGSPYAFVPRYGKVVGLFEFFPADRARLDELRQMGVLPWWTQADIQGGFFRPLTGLTHLFDWVVIGNHPALHHLQSLGWFAAVLLAAGAFFRAWLGPGRAAAVATLLFAVDESHALPAGWMANRNALLAMLFVTLAARSHLAAIEGRPRAALLTAAWTAAALASAEAGTAAFFVFAALELGRGGSPRARVARWLPVGLVGVAWAALWAGLGFGMHGSGLYLDPVREPLAWLTALPHRLGVLGAAAWLNAPADLWMFLPLDVERAVGFVLLVLTAAFVTAVVGGVRADPRVLQGLVLAGVALLPPSAAFPMTRVVGVAGLGVAGVLGVVAVAGSAGLARRAALVLHGPIAAVMLFGQALGAPALLGAANATADVAPDRPEVADQHVVLLRGMEVFTAYVAMIRGFDGRAGPASLVLLAPMGQPMTVERMDARTVRVRVEGGAFRVVGERLCRAKPFEVGETSRSGAAAVTVREVTADGFPVEWDVQFDVPADDPSLLWRAPDGFATAPWVPPAIGERVAVPSMFPWQ